MFVYLTYISALHRLPRMTFNNVGSALSAVNAIVKSSIVRTTYTRIYICIRLGVKATTLKAKAKAKWT